MFPRMKTIVVGYESSEAAERALARAAEVAQALSARLLVVSVTESAYVPVRIAALEPAGPELMGPAVAGPLATGGPLPLPGQQETEPEALARRELERARMSLASQSLEVEYIVEIGDAAERLLQVAEEHDADLIVVGSPAHGFLDRLLGRGVDQALARADRDVLLVH
jgi:nucleotide-binding universal stress UspA family protein